MLSALHPNSGAKSYTPSHSNVQKFRNRLHEKQKQGENTHNRSENDNQSTQLSETSLRPPKSSTLTRDKQNEKTPSRQKTVVTATTIWPPHQRIPHTPSKILLLTPPGWDSQNGRQSFFFLVFLRSSSEKIENFATKRQLHLYL